MPNQKKKNYRNIPKKILEKLNKLDGDIIVEVVVKSSHADVEKGLYAHLGIGVSETMIVLPSESIIPDFKRGRFSGYNVNGREIKRRDLPMITKTYSQDVPNFGDWSHGSHEISHDIEVYQKDFYPPRNLRVSVELLDEDGTQEVRNYIMKFTIIEPLAKNDPSFLDDLLFNINLLQENVGSVDVFSSHSSRDEYLNNIQLDWEILPPGSKEDIISRILSGFRNPSANIQQEIAERYELLQSLQPIAYIKGSSGFERYFGAQFSDDLVAFENIAYGNALYVMFENWKDLSKLSRLELLKRKQNDFERIVHSSGWETRLQKLIEEKRK